MAAAYSMSRYPSKPVKLRDELTCDCEKNCASHGPEYQQFHDCEILEELFSQVPTLNLQKLYTKSEFMNKISFQEFENGGVDIVISCIPKTIENGGKTNEEVLQEFKMRRYDDKGDDKIIDVEPGAISLQTGVPKSATFTLHNQVLNSNLPKLPSLGDNIILSTGHIEYDYLDINTGKIVPFPTSSDSEFHSDSDEDRKRRRKHRKKTSGKEKTEETTILKKKKTINKDNKFHTKRDKNLECTWPECSGKFFPGLSHLNRHIKAMHTKIKFVCPRPGCGKEFPYKENVIRHIQRVHDSIRPHKCPHCEKTFKSKYNLADHIRTHTGEKPFECEYCGNTFAQNGSLVGHRKRCQKKIIQESRKQEDQQTIPVYQMQNNVQPQNSQIIGYNSGSIT